MNNVQDLMRSIDVDLFTAAIRDREALYNSQHPDYLKKSSRAKLWNEIGEILYPEWNEWSPENRIKIGKMLRRKWHGLYSRFVSWIRKHNSKGPLDSLNNHKYIHNLTFLRKTNRVLKNLKPDMRRSERRKSSQSKVKPRSQPKSNFKSQAKLKSKTRSKPQSKTQPKPQLQRKAQPEPQFECKREFEPSKSPPFTSDEDDSRKASEDGDRWFLLSFVRDMKTLPFSTKCWVKMKFSEIMHQAALSLDARIYSHQSPKSEQNDSLIERCTSGELSDRECLNVLDDRRPSGQSSEGERVSPASSLVGEDDIKILTPSSPDIRVEEYI